VIAKGQAPNENASKLERDGRKEGERVAIFSSCCSCSS